MYSLLNALILYPQDLSEYDVNKAMDGHEGCNIYGWLDLQRVAGSLRISVHIEDFFQLAKASAALHGLHAPNGLQL